VVQFPTAYGLRQYDTFLLRFRTIDVQNRKVRTSTVLAADQYLVVISSSTAAHGDFSTVTIRPGYATCGTVIYQTYGNEGTRRPTITSLRAYGRTYSYGTPTVYGT